MRKFLAPLLGLTLLAGCASTTKQETAAHHPYTKAAEVTIKWRTTIGAGPGYLYARLEPAVDGDQVYAADVNGSVQSLSLEKGKQHWRIQLDQPINSGVALARQQLLVTTKNGYLLSLERATGAEQWRALMPSEAISTPTVGDDGRVYVHTVDGNITAFSLSNGQQLWSYQSAMPVLTVRGTSSPLVLEQLVVVGLASGKVIALDKQLGVPRWEVRLASPDGRSELERLVDIDGRPVWNNGLIYAASYNGKLAAINLQGEIHWEEEGSSYTRPELALGNLYLTLDNDTIQAYDILNGARVWQQSALSGLKLGQITAYNNWLTVADNNGNLYVLSQVSGELVNYRLLRPTPLHLNAPNQTTATQWRPLRGKHMGIRANLISTEQGILVYSNSGELLLIDIEPGRRWLGIF